MRIGLLAQKPIGEWTYRLAQHYPGIAVAFVVTNLRPCGWWHSAEIAQDPAYMGAVIDNAQRNETAIVNAVYTHAADALLSVQHPWILSPGVLDSVPITANVHLAPLPEYPGSRCAARAVEDKAPEFGYTVHEMVAEVDAGPTIIAERWPLTGQESVHEVYRKAETRARCGVAYTLEWLACAA
jgi:methionyl-tRNA formyltransferase